MAEEESGIEAAIGDAVDTAEAASNSTALDVVARSGFAVMALLHIVIGAIAVALVLGAPGQAEPTGAIEQLAANPWGPAVMWAACIACAGLALWQLSEATLRGRHLPRREQLGKLISSGFLAIAYGSVGLSFAGFGLGQRGDSGDSTRDFSTALIQSPLGVPALVGLGLTIMGIGVYFIVKGFGKKFKEELQHFEGTRRGKVISAAWRHRPRLERAGADPDRAALRRGRGDQQSRFLHRPGRQPQGAPGPPLRPVPAPGNRGRASLPTACSRWSGRASAGCSRRPGWGFSCLASARGTIVELPRAGLGRPPAAGLAEVWHELRSGEQTHPPTAP